jgi:hypothetical protein
MDSLRRRLMMAFTLACELGCLIWPAAMSGQSRIPSLSPAKSGKVTTLLKEIYGEVRELGPRPGEDFIRHEFFVGEGDDDTYKDFHLVVLIQDIPGGRRMTVQVTRLVPDPQTPRVKYGRDPKTVVCLIERERLEVSRKDYSEKELMSLLPDLLRAIRDRKKLIRDHLGPPGGGGRARIISP